MEKIIGTFILSVMLFYAVSVQYSATKTMEFPVEQLDSSTLLVKDQYRYFRVSSQDFQVQDGLITTSRSKLRRMSK